MTDPRYTRTKIRHELHAADGSVINYSVNEHMIERGYVEQHPGSRLVEIVDTIEVAPYERVLIDSGIPEERRAMTRAELQQWCDNVVPQRRGFLATFARLLCIVIGVPLLLAFPGMAVAMYAGPLAAVATILVLGVALLALLISGPHDAAPRSRNGRGAR
jgi:hypothetical protein